MKAEVGSRFLESSTSSLQCANIYLIYTSLFSCALNAYVFVKIFLMSLSVWWVWYSKT